MLTFSQPAILLLLPIAGLLLWRWYRRRQPAVRYPDTGLLSELPAGRSRLAPEAGIGFRAAGLIFLIPAPAGPRLPDRGSPIAPGGIAIGMGGDGRGSVG